MSPGNAIATFTWLTPFSARRHGGSARLEVAHLSLGGAGKGQMAGNGREWAFRQPGRYRAYAPSQARPGERQRRCAARRRVANRRGALAVRELSGFGIREFVNVKTVYVR